MINIQDARVLDYPDGSGFVTVYQDMDTTLNRWYIVPEPAYASNASGDAMFALNEFTSEGGELMGTCSFVVDLRISQRALDLARKHLPEADFGQLQWLSSAAFFNYQIEGQDQIAFAEPSMAGDNRAAFVIQLPSQAAIETFRTAFGPGNADSGFTLAYDVTTLASLPAVDVTVRYNSEIAFEYNKTVDINRNVWGKETSRKTSIREHLKNSDAGDVDIVWGVANPSEELQQRVNLWAWTTLEGLVDKAMADAVAQMGVGNADNFSLSATFDLERTYSENEVIEWVLGPVTTLPSFSADEWDKHYRKSDHQRLAIAFNLLDLLEDQAAPESTVESVQVEVKYPTLAGDNSHIFRKDDGQTTWAINADGHRVDGVYDPSYEFRIIVTFAARSQTYTSPWQRTDATEQLINTGELGIQTAQFEAANIDFEHTTDFVLINVVWDTAEEADRLSQEKKMTQISPSRTVRFDSNTFTRSTNGYTYQLVFVQKDGNRIAVAPRRIDGPQNRRHVLVSNPFQPATFNVKVWKDADDPRTIDYVALTATYDDPVNGVSGLSHQWEWESPQPPRRFPVSLQPSFQVDVIENPNGSFVEYNGFLILSDGNVQDIRNLRNQNKQMLLLPNTEWWGVLFKGEQIDWERVQSVAVDAWRLPSSEPLTRLNLGPEPGLHMLGTAEDRIDPGNFTFQAGLQDADGQPFKTPNQIYNFRRQAGHVATFYYTAAYHMVDGTFTYAQGDDVSDGVVSLPPIGSTATPVVNRGVVMRRAAA